VLHEGDTLAASLIEYALYDGACGLASIAVPPPLRGHGRSARLIQGVIEALQSEGMRAFYLYSEIAPEFYERLGFVRLPDAFQLKPETPCLVRCEDPRALFESPGFKPPPVF
jgi:N-acetylglutamate synthase-like GNAT family acetyltransferase